MLCKTKLQSATTNKSATTTKNMVKNKATISNNKQNVWIYCYFYWLYL